jgi:hypothetical protein
MAGPFFKRADGGLELNFKSLSCCNASRRL